MAYDLDIADRIRAIVRAADDGLVRLHVRDDGVGGADPSRGSGLIGLKDRVEATHGTLRVDSRPGQGTSLLVKLPLDPGQPLDPFSRLAPAPGPR